MASSGNFCTLNPLAQLGGSTDASTRAGSMSNGNLKYVNLTGNTAVGNFGVTSGKWYYEVFVSSFNSDNGMTIGWANDLFNLDAELGYNSPSSPSGGQAFGLYSQNQSLIYGPGDGSSTFNKSYGSGTPSDGDIIRIWLDADNGRFWAGLNGTIWGSGDPSAGSNWGFGTGGSPHNVAMTSRTLYPAIGNWSGADATVIFNFGQDSTFQGNVSAGGNADGNGFGDFKYDPDGFLALCSANLPISDDIDPAQTSTNYPQKQFAPILWTGNGSTQSITGLGFQPDMVWIKERSGTQDPSIYDSNRGVTKRLKSSAAEAETTVAAGFTAFDSDGFSLGSATENNDNTETFVGWSWRCNGGTTSSDSSADITVTRQSNTASGFAILTYSGNGSDNQTIAHGLGAKPAFIIIKNRDTTNGWSAWTQHLGDNSKWIQLDQSTASQSDSNQFYNSGMTTSNIGVRSGASVNGSGNDLVAYVWAEVDGYSKFGAYEGNANANGVFVYTGFRPRMIFVKDMDRSENWQTFDTVRNTFNPVDKGLSWNADSAESTGSGSGFDVDFLSNGFKMRCTHDNLNGSSTYIYGAWGDVPFRYNNTF